MQTTSEMDEERTNQLVSDLLRNIKEKTRELESLNQNLKSNSSSSSNLNFQDQSGFNQATEFSTSQTAVALSPLPPAETTTSTAQKQQQTKNKSRKGQKSRASLKEAMVPIGWSRTIVDNLSVVYTNPNGAKFHSIDEIRTYLLTDNTCKCGLECPLNINKTFNFDASAVQSTSSLCSDAPSSRSRNGNSSCCSHRSSESRTKRTKRPVTTKRHVGSSRLAASARNKPLSEAKSPHLVPIESLDDHLEFFVAHNMFKDETAATSLFSGLNLDDETKLKCEKGACDEVMIELGDLNDSLLDTSLDGGQNSAENDLGFFYFEDKAKLMNDKANIELNVRRRF